MKRVYGKIILSRRNQIKGNGNISNKTRETMLEILGYFLLIVIVFAIIKYSLAFIIRVTAIAITSFLAVGAVAGLLTIFGLISSDVAWTIALIAFFLGLAYNMYELFSRPSEIISDTKHMVKDNPKPRYDTDGYEINHYPTKRCCGNCRYNMSRSPENYMSIYCTWNSFYHNELCYKQDDVCPHWEHF